VGRKGSVIQQIMFINIKMKEFIVLNSQCHSEIEFQQMGIMVDVIRFESNKQS